MYNGYTEKAIDKSEPSTSLLLFCLDAVKCALPKQVKPFSV
jgi:hypothetical protein